MDPHIALVTSQVNRQKGVAYIDTVLDRQSMTEAQLSTLANRIAGRLGHLIENIVFYPYKNKFIVWVEMSLRSGRLRLRQLMRQFGRLLEAAGCGRRDHSLLATASHRLSKQRAAKPQHRRADNITREAPPGASSLC